MTRRALAALLILAVTAAVLHAMGRRLWCECGSPVPWSTDIWSGHNSQHLLDPYFFTHVSHGFVLWWILRALRVRRPALYALGAESAWEIFENSDMVLQRYRAATISLDYYGDSILNSLGDVGACMLGFVIASRLPIRVSVAVFVISELTLALWIRDGLILNAIMLAHPIDAIRAWQIQKF